MGCITSIFDLPDNMLTILTILRHNCGQSWGDEPGADCGTIGWRELRQTMGNYVEGSGRDRSRRTELAMRRLMATSIAPVEYPGQRFAILQSFTIVDNETVHFQINPEFLKYTAKTAVQ